MGKLIKSKNFGKNLKVNLYYFRDGYRIYAQRRQMPNSKYWIESQATSFPISDKSKAIEYINDYKNKDDVLLLHPVLRDSGTSMSSGFGYKMEKDNDKIFKKHFKR